MPGVARDGDKTTTGHGCDAITTVTGPTGLPAKVFANGIPIECKGNPTALHTILKGSICVPHLIEQIVGGEDGPILALVSPIINVGSPNVFVGGIPVARIGDSTDGGIIFTGSPNVIAN
jgi:uncharacterized Zn-binding protein involved in type VI secretion